MRKMIEFEYPEKRVSNGGISQALHVEGALGARRTVTKYLKHMHIAPSTRRRKTLAPYISVRSE